MAPTASRHDPYAFTGAEERAYAIASMRPYFTNEPEQVKFFRAQAAQVLGGGGPLRVLDTCAGLGDLTYHLRPINPQARYVVSDRAQFLLDAGREYFTDASNVSFQAADVYALQAAFGAKAFDVTLCKQTLSWLPDYRDAVREMIAVTRGAIFVSSLFYDGRVDVEIRVREWAIAAAQDGHTSYYNVYSLPEFRDFCLAHGARAVEGADFHIGIDLPRPASPDRMGSYTRRLDTGERLLFSGAVYMPWKIVRIDV